MTPQTLVAIWTQPDVLRLVALATFSVLLWRVPVVSLIVYPFRLFNTFIHEASHGAAAVLTGGEFRYLVVRPNRTGAAMVVGGSMVVIGSAGYLGSALVGALLLFLAATDLADQMLLVLLGIGLALLCLVFVRNMFGFVAGFLLSAALLLAGMYLPAAMAMQVVLFLAVQLALSAIDSVVTVLRIAAGAPSSARSDAHRVADATGVPALVWALAWVVASVALLLVAIAAVYQRGV